MKNFKLLAIAGAALVIGLVLAGCKSMQLNYLESDTVDGPKMVRQGEDIAPNLITVWGIYRDESRKMVRVNSTNIIFNKHVPGPQTVRIRVSNQEVSFQTEVMALRSLTIASQPRTTVFKAGQEADRSWPGLEVRGEWDQMGSDRISLSSCEITGFMKDQPGRQTITISYEGVRATFNVDVRAMTSLQIVQAPAKLDYAQGDSLDLTGMNVVGVWEGLPQEQLSISASDITGFNGNNVGIQRLTVTKNGKTATFNVEVLRLTSIVLDKPPDKTDYKLGEPLELAGIIVNGNYTGTVATKKMTQPIPENQFTISGYDSNRVGRQQRVTVTVMEQIANFFVNIEMPDGSSGTPAQTILAGTWKHTTGSSTLTYTFNGNNYTATGTGVFNSTNGSGTFIIYGSNITLNPIGGESVTMAFSLSGNSLNMGFIFIKQ
jgi:hypothetical protein